MIGNCRYERQLEGHPTTIRLLQFRRGLSASPMNPSPLQLDSLPTSKERLGTESKKNSPAVHVKPYEAPEV